MVALASFCAGRTVTLHALVGVHGRAVTTATLHADQTVQLAVELGAK